jgi:hypothetical protein
MKKILALFLIYISTISTFAQVGMRGTQGPLRESTLGVPSFNTYKMVSHREPISFPPLPDVSAGAGTTITDPVFGTSITRLSDASIYPNQNTDGVNGLGVTIHTSSAADHNCTSVTGDKLYIIDSGGSVIPVKFDIKTKAKSFYSPTVNSPDYDGNTSGTPGVSGVGPRLIQLRNEPDFSYEDNDIMYGAAQTQTAAHPTIKKYKISTDTYSTAVDLNGTGFNFTNTNASIGEFIAYVSASNSDDGLYGTPHGERLCVLAGSQNADFEYLVFIVNAVTGNIVKILDTRHLKSGTASGNMTAYANTVLPFERTAGTLTADNGTSLVYTSSSANGFVPIEGLIKIGSELIDFTSRSVSGSGPYTVTLSSLTRGVRSTTNVTHSNGDIVKLESVDLHGGTITRDGHYVYLTKSPLMQTNGQDIVVWDIDNNTLTFITVDNTGHFVQGFNVLVNQNGQHDGMDWEVRKASDPNNNVYFAAGASTNERYNVAIDNLSGSGNFNIADHTSQNQAKASQPYAMVLTGDYRYPTGGTLAYNYGSRAVAEWDDELVLIDINPTSKNQFLRAAQHRSRVSDDVKLTGTAAYSSSSNTTTLVGTGTLFLTALIVGDYISICSWDGSSGNNNVSGTVRKVTAITDDTHLTVDRAFTTTASGLNVFQAQKGTTVPPFYYTPRPPISQRGDYAIFTSNWNGSLGVPKITDVSHRAFRTDVFVVELPTSIPTTPVVSNDSASSVSNTSETVTFDTSASGDSVVEYSTDSSYNNSTKDYILKTTGHSVTLTGLSAGTLYNYRITSRIRGVTSSSVTGSFTTTGSAPADFVTDSFTESSDTTLASHTGSVGATWTKHPAAAYTSTATVDAATDRVYPLAITAYYASGVPPSADYYVQADFYAASIISVNAAIVGRMDTTADTMYLVRLNNGTVWELRKIVAGSATTLGSDSTAGNLPTVGNSKTVKLVMTGSTITVFVSGVSVISVTDTDITSAGKAGLRFSGTATSTTGFHIDNFSAR